jgi:hypothetical protein
MEVKNLDPKYNTSFCASMQEVGGITLASANTDLRPVRGFYPNPNCEDDLSDLLENFRLSYRLEIKNDSDSFWKELFDAYMTQPVTLSLVSMLEKRILETPTPAIFSGSSPEIIYGVNQRFLETYGNQIKQAYGLQEEMVQIFNGLERNWKTLPGTEIDRLRERLMAIKNKPLSNGDLGEHIRLLQRVEENQRVIDKWANLRKELSEKGRKFEFGWIELVD